MKNPPATSSTHHGLFSRVALKRFRPGYVLPWHDHPHACICVLLAGGMFEACDGFSRDVVAGALIYKPPAVRHRNVFHTDTSVLTFELHSLTRDSGGSPFLPDHPVMLRSEHIRRLGHRIAHELSIGVQDAASALLIDGLGLELTAEVPRDVTRPRQHAPVWLQRVRDRIASDFRAPQAIATYAAGADVHPSYLARMFRAHFGEPIGRYIRQLRLAYAAEQLRLTNEPIAQIALSAGFADQSHFAHAFRREQAMSPGEFRRRSLESRH